MTFCCTGMPDTTFSLFIEVKVSDLAAGWGGLNKLADAA